MQSRPKKKGSSLYADPSHSGKDNIQLLIPTIGDDSL